MSDYCSFALADDGGFYAVVKDKGAQYWAPFESKPGPNCIGSDLAHWHNVLGCGNPWCPHCTIICADGSRLED
jgi:hypothetical protein